MEAVQGQKRDRQKIPRIVLSVKAVFRGDAPRFKMAILLVQIKQQSLIQLSRSVHQREIGVILEVVTVRRENRKPLTFRLQALLDDTKVDGFIIFCA